jgi:dTDP-glucose 4,6-dehydratase/UDP-glucose 4-epimerase
MDSFHLSRYSYFQFTSDDNLLKRIFQQVKPDICINCAGAANVQASFTDPLYDFDLNVRLIVSILEACRFSNHETRLIQISSAAVYGNPEILPVKSNVKPLPISPYGVHKLISEELVAHFGSIFGLKTCSLRIFSAYGNGQRKLFLWDCFNKLNFSKTHVTFYGTGNESRDFIHIDDIAAQIRLILKNSKFDGEVYNVANGREVRIQEIVDTMLDVLNKNLHVEFSGEVRSGDPLHWCADITPIINWGYKQTVSIENGVKNYVQWALENA